MARGLLSGIGKNSRFGCFFYGYGPVNRFTLRNETFTRQNRGFTCQNPKIPSETEEIPAKTILWKLAHYHKQKKERKGTLPSFLFKLKTE